MLYKSLYNTQHATTYNMMSKTMAVCERWTLFGGLTILLYSVNQSIKTR